MVQRQASAERVDAVHLGDSTDFVDIHAQDGWLEIALVGAPDGDHIYRGMRQGYASGWITAAMPTLVDVLAFSGRIDWAAIKAVAQMTEWGRGQSPSRVAYLTRDPLFTLVVKVVAVLFPNSLHRVFGNRHAAMVWLQASP
jgi:hypothetical protein